MTALRALHQLDLFGTRLVVEYAKDTNLNKESTNKTDLESRKEEFFASLNSISTKFNIKQPISPLLKYKYPTVSTSIIRNISKALFNCPKFYVQVLHLMNKMNLPPPFINTDHDFEEQFMQKNFACNTIELNSESSESELEVEVDKDDKPKDNQITKLIEEKKRKLDNLKNETKKLKLDDESRIKTKETINEYFDSYANLKTHNRIQIDKDLKLVDKIDQEASLEGFNKFKSQPLIQLDQCSTDVKDDNKEEETSLPIELKRLSLEELNNYPVFKNYSIGEPSCRLYIKNIDKKVTEKQLQNVYLEILNLKYEQDLIAFNVNLFKKGKLNGQAFVSLPSEELARQAIEKTNGLLINKKPIVVCYARSIKAKEDE